MEAITFEDAVIKLKSSSEGEKILIQDFDAIVKVLRLLFTKDKGEVKKAFQIPMSDEEVVEYARNAILSLLGRQMIADDIKKIEVIPGLKKLCIQANANFDPDENYSCLDAENYIRNKIMIFTGYDVKIDL